MYTATNAERVVESGVVRWIVTFSNGTDTFKDSFTGGDFAWMKNAVRNKLALLNETPPAPGPVDTTLTPPTQTQAEIDRQAWFVLFYRWNTVKKNLVDTGIVALSNAKVQALLAQVQAGLKPEYVDFM